MYTNVTLMNKRELRKILLCFIFFTYHKVLTSVPDPDPFHFRLPDLAFKKKQP